MIVNILTILCFTYLAGMVTVGAVQTEDTTYIVIAGLLWLLTIGVTVASIKEHKEKRENHTQRTPTGASK